MKADAQAGPVAPRRRAERRARLRRLMALEIEETPDFLRLYKLAGLNLVTTEAAVPGTSRGRSMGEYALVRSSATSPAIYWNR